MEVPNALPQRSSLYVCRFLLIHPLHVDLPGASATANDGLDAPLVFVLPAIGGYHCLFALEIQVDTDVFHDSRPGVHLREPVQARDPRQDADASPSEPLVRPSRHCLYVRIRRTWCSYGDGRLSAFHQKENNGKR